jgi:hypothetical protein
MEFSFSFLVLTFYIWDRVFTENFDDFTILIFIFNLIKCIRISRNTDIHLYSKLHACNGSVVLRIVLEKSI